MLGLDSKVARKVFRAKIKVVLSVIRVGCRKNVETFKSKFTITPPEANSSVHVAERITFGKMANRAMVHLIQGVRHRAEDCVAPAWNPASVVNDPFGARGNTPLYL
jgi:hypothetical protein